MGIMSKLRDALELLRKYPRVKKIKVDFEKQLIHEIEFFEPHRKPQVQEQESLPRPTNDMPPDDVMLFASTPTFDEMIGDKEKR